MAVPLRCRAATARQVSCRLLSAAWLCLALAAGSALAAPEEIEPRTRLLHSLVDYRVNADGTFVESRAWELSVLDARAIAGAKEASISYSTSVETAEILEASTRKPDGRRIDAPKTNFQVHKASGEGGNAPLFSDRTTLTVVFPEVEVGDRLVFSSRLTASQPLFPGQFSTFEGFSPRVPYDEASIHISVPGDLAVQQQAYGLQAEPPTLKDGRRDFVWHFANPHPTRATRRDWSVVDVTQQTALLFSTFQDYRQIADAYGARALPKAVPDQRVRALADEITQGKTTPLEIARSLYEWVSRNITYGGNCIGLGAVVPHDTSLILDNRMGDCKDHATLLQALLAAKGIASDQALINAGQVYTLPPIPVVSMVNHVINYLPDFDLFLDSTSDSTPFGMLPDQDEAKPVLLVAHYREGTHTPASRAGSNEEITDSVVSIASDGSFKVAVDISNRGSYAVSMREGMRQISREQEATMITDSFKSRGLIASGLIHKDDPKPLEDRYHLSTEFEIQKVLQRPGAGGFPVLPLFSGAAPVAMFLYSAMGTEPESHPFRCSSGRSIERYRYEFPAEL